MTRDEYILELVRFRDPELAGQVQRLADYAFPPTPAEGTDAVPIIHGAEELQAHESALRKKWRQAMRHEIGRIFQRFVGGISNGGADCAEYFPKSAVVITEERLVKRLGLEDS